jgi:transposase
VADAPVTVVMEPTRNAWVPLAAWLRGRGATVQLVPSEQSADLRRYYNKHAKTDRLDCELLARLPLLHPDGLRPTPGLGPGEALRRAVGHRQSLVARRTACSQRLDGLLELLGPGWTAVLGVDLGKTALTVLERYADPHALQRLGRARLTKVMMRASRRSWREDCADALLAAARETLKLWPDGAIDFAELAEDIAIEARSIRQLTDEIDALEDRIATHYEAADPDGIVALAPGGGVILAPMILGRLGDAKRFRDLAAVRNYTGLLPKVDQSGISDKRQGLSKAGDPLLRYALLMAADHGRKTDPNLAACYYRLRAAGKHHNSALCTLATVLVTRIAACWRNDEHYVLRDLDGNPISEAEGRQTSSPSTATCGGSRHRQGVAGCADDRSVRPWQRWQAHAVGRPRTRPPCRLALGGRRGGAALRGLQGRAGPGVGGPGARMATAAGAARDLPAA